MQQLGMGLPLQQLLQQQALQQQQQQTHCSSSLHRVSEQQHVLPVRFGASCVIQRNLSSSFCCMYALACVVWFHVQLSMVCLRCVAGGSINPQCEKWCHCCDWWLEEVLEA